MTLMKRILLAVAALSAALGLSGCGYNDMAQGDQSIKAAWSEVLNQYQRRSDLIPNLVNTVKGYASQEQDTLTMWSKRAPELPVFKPPLS